MSEEDKELDSGEDEIDVGTNETDSINYNAVVGIQNDHHFGNFAIPQTVTQQADRKRAHHNALERKRRDHIKDSFHTLRDAIPNIKGEKINIKTSRAQILKAATEYIRFMRSKNTDYQKDIDVLKKQNTDIESQIRQLEKARAASQFARQTNNDTITTTMNNNNNNQQSATNDFNENIFLKPKRFKNILNNNSNTNSS